MAAGPGSQGATVRELQLLPQPPLPGPARLCNGTLLVNSVSPAAAAPACTKRRRRQRVMLQEGRATT
ncbi:hypothetical protein NDU88_005560 [Pleurodeles waltl]|uniref:Uncharacterized protein n=1 Tax=Pleurodeles waltl TaxID=8319 RepID=A0AAV7MD79_PLEWA|nr:hypothetical protein NDU88_005560 [Pleurodeles waltl]